MTEWEVIEPRPGLARDHGPAVTVYGRPASGDRKQAEFVVVLNRPAVELFDWRPRMRLALRVRRSTGRILLTPATDEERGWALAAQPTGGRLEARLRLPWLSPDVRSGSVRAVWERDEGGLSIHLPEWARAPVEKGKPKLRVA